MDKQLLEITANLPEKVISDNRLSDMPVRLGNETQFEYDLFSFWMEKGRGYSVNKAIAEYIFEKTGRDITQSTRISDIVEISRRNIWKERSKDYYLVVEEQRKAKRQEVIEAITDNEFIARINQAKIWRARAQMIRTQIDELSNKEFDSETNYYDADGEKTSGSSKRDIAQKMQAISELEKTALSYEKEAAKLIANMTGIETPNKVALTDITGTQSVSVNNVLATLVVGFERFGDIPQIEVLDE